MKNLKSKIRDFLSCEDGRAGVKAPLTLGVSAGGLMLAQAIVSTPLAQAGDGYDPCETDADCGEGTSGDECVEKSFYGGETWDWSWVWEWDSSLSIWVSYEVFTLVVIPEYHMVCD